MAWKARVSSCLPLICNAFRPAGYEDADLRPWKRTNVETCRVCDDQYQIGSSVHGEKQQDKDRVIKYDWKIRPRSRYPHFYLRQAPC